MLNLTRLSPKLLTGMGLALALLIVFIFMNPSHATPEVVMPESQVTWSPALKAGEKAPDFTLRDHNGQPFTLSLALEEGPVLITFFRGNWCPICSAQLKKLDLDYDLIKTLGAEVVAISAQLPIDTAETQDRFGIRMPVLSDTGMAVTKLYGVQWQMPEQIRAKTNAFVESSENQSLGQINGDGGLALPVPATYVIDQKGVIVYAFAHEDYTQRAKNETLLQALKALKKTLQN